MRVWRKGGVEWGRGGGGERNWNGKVRVLIQLERSWTYEKLDIEFTLKSKTVLHF